MEEIKITSKHISDENYKRSLIGRPLVPFYGDSPIEERPAVTHSVAAHASVVARKWNPDGYFEPEERLYAPLQHAGSRDTTQLASEAGYSRRKTKGVAATATHVGDIRSASAGRHTALQSNTATPKPSKGKRDKRVDKGSEHVDVTGSESTSAKAFAWSRFQQAPDASMLPLPDVFPSRASRKSSKEIRRAASAETRSSGASKKGWTSLSDLASADSESIRSGSHGTKSAHKPATRVVHAVASATDVSQPLSVEDLFNSVAVSKISPSPVSATPLSVDQLFASVKPAATTAQLFASVKPAATIAPAQQVSKPSATAVAAVAPKTAAETSRTAVSPPAAEPTSVVKPASEQKPSKPVTKPMFAPTQVLKSKV